MSTELICLVWSTLLGFLYINAQVITLRIHQGVKGYDPNRDRPVDHSVHSARAERALRNFLESYPLFIALVAAAELSGTHGWLTQWGAILYLAGRTAYLPLYVLGIAPVRSLTWAIAFAGLAMIFAGLVF
jgi:uncharacterized MAPEG superfamily protein